MVRAVLVLDRLPMSRRPAGRMVPLVFADSMSGAEGRGLTINVSTPNVTHLNGLVDWSPASTSEARRAQFEGEGYRGWRL